MVTVTVDTGQGYGRYVRGALAVASRVLVCFGPKVSLSTISAGERSMVRSIERSLSICSLTRRLGICGIRSAMLLEDCVFAPRPRGVLTAIAFDRWAATQGQLRARMRARCKPQL